MTIPRLSNIKPLTGSRGSLLALAGTVAAVAFAGGSAALPAAAEATTASTCPETTLSQPFLTNWKDAGYYSLVAGGSFEAGETAWTLSGGAKAASGSETFAVTGKPGKSSLDLLSGATAASPLTCVEPTDRTFRFFDRYEGSAATLTVKVVYESSTGSSKTSVTISKTLSVSNSGWAPSPIFETGVPPSSMVTGGVSHVLISFTATKGTARIDDVYLDPHMR
jgi:hypothetical protein